MLSRLITRIPVAMKPRPQIVVQQMRFFRPGTINAYRHDPVDMDEGERRNQESRPVWDRVFDHKKYMEHEGPMKLSTGIAYLDVEPFPRMKLMKLYYLTLQELKDLPDAYGYKFLSQEMTRYRMKIVDENLSVRKIEEEISSGIMKNWKPWDHLRARDDADKEMVHRFSNFSFAHPFPDAYEAYDEMKHEAGARRPSAAMHPEDKE